MASPNRRSTADLQRILEGLIGDRGSIPCHDLPDVLLKYESEHDVIILEPGEYEGLRLLCGQNPEIELEAKDIFNFLSIIPRVGSKMPHALPHSTSMPDSAMRGAQHTRAGMTRATRRHSDRVRSPSDSSGSESDTGAQTRVRKTSGSQPFPGGSSLIPSNLPRPVGLPHSTLSDLSMSHDSPRGPRKRGTNQPPSAYSPFGAFARPSPASRRRRGSTESAPASDIMGDESTNPRPPSQTRIRKISQPSMRASSPLWSGSQPSNPGSPLLPIFGSSYQSMPATDAEWAPLEEQDIKEADLSLALADEGTSDALEELDQVGDDVPRPTLSHNDSLNPRLSRISTESAASLRTSHDKLQSLQKQNVELARKLKEVEKQLAVLGAENERMVEDLQERLEEAKSEIAMKRKDEKDLKSKDRAQMIQISGFEADISSLQRSLEAAKANHANMSKMYNSQCGKSFKQSQMAPSADRTDEAQRLRDLLRDRDEEIQRLEDVSQVHEGEEYKYTHEVKMLQGEVTRLEQDLQIARQAESHLETQKQENLQLKETIDRMRFDLEEARTNNAVQGHSRGATSSGAGTLSRNLGAEISRRLVDADSPTKSAAREEDHDGSDDEEYVETVVTTHRTRKSGTRTSSHGATNSRPADDQQQVQEDCVYADVAVNTEPESLAVGPSTSPGSPPAYSAEPDPMTAEHAPGKVHPRGLVGGIDDRYDAIVQSTGIRCTVLEHELNNKRSEVSAKGPRPIPEGLLGFVTISPELVAHYAPYLVAAFAVGVIIGSGLFSVTSRDAALFLRMNTLAVASGAGEGFLPFGQRGVVGFVENGAKMVAGRVPT